MGREAYCSDLLAGLRGHQEACSPQMSPSPGGETRHVADQHSTDKQTLRLETRTGENDNIHRRNSIDCVAVYAKKRFPPLHVYLYLHLSPYHRGLWGTTSDFTTSFRNFSLFSTALWDSVNSRPVNSLMLPSHLFFCLPSILPLLPLSLCLARWF